MNGKSFGIPCFSPGFGGLEMNTIRLALWMQDRGWRVPLLLRDGSAIHQKAIEAGLDVALIRASTSTFGEAKTIARWVKQYKLNTLLVPFRNDLKAVSFYKLFHNRKINIVYQQHMKVGVSKRDPIHTLRYSTINAWISPLTYLKEETIAKTRISAGKISVIPFGLEASELENTAWTREKAREDLGLPANSKMIGVLGRIDPKKGQDLAIKGIHRLKNHYDLDYHLLLLGDATLDEGDEFSRQLKTLVDDFQVNDRVHFRSYKPDIMEFFRAIDVFAMPSHGETFGMVTLESMAAGIPVVGTDRDGTREILRNGELGYLFPKDNVDAFCRQIIAIAENKSLPQMLQQAKDEVVKNYGKDEMCVQLEALLETL